MVQEAKSVKSVRFTTTKYKELRVVLDPSAKKEIGGAAITVGLRGAFGNGLPVSVQFMGGEYITSDPEVIAALKAHLNYGMAFIADDEKGEPKPTQEAIKHKNEKHELAEEVRSKCPECGKTFKTDFALKGHMRSHKK